MMPFYDPRFPGDGKARHFQLILRRRPDGKDMEMDSDVRQELAQIIAYLEALRNGKEFPVPALEKAPGTEVADAQSPVPEPPRLTLPGNRDSLARKFKLARVRLGSKINEEPRLSRKDILGDAALLTDSNLFADEPGEPETRVSLPPCEPKPARAAPPRRRAGWRFALGGGLLLVVLAGAAYLWVRPAAPTRADRNVAANPAWEGALSAEASRTAELVLHSIQLGKLETASGALADAQKHGVILPGLRYQAALLALRQGDTRGAADWIAQSIAARESIPESLYLRANLTAGAGDYATVCELFEEAAGCTAFSPRYYFFWGEALRRYGHSAQALVQFERALLCRPSSADIELIRFKAGLAQIEAGVDGKFETDLQTLLAQKTVPGDVLLLAAAFEINRAAYPAAAGYLQRAREAMPAVLLAGRLRDFMFQGRARQPDLAAVWPGTAPANPASPANSADSVPTTRPPVVVVDPATRSLAEADPAVW